MIECDLREIREHELLSEGKEKKKFGRYHGSMFWSIPGFGSKKWVVAARIDFKQELPTNLGDLEIIEKCVEFLNTPPPRKKFQRRVTKPKYGNLGLYNAKVIRREGHTYISALLITDKRNSKHFWGKGVVTAK